MATRTPRRGKAAAPSAPELEDVILPQVNDLREAMLEIAAF